MRRVEIVGSTKNNHSTMSRYSERKEAKYEEVSDMETDEKYEGPDTVDATRAQDDWSGVSQLQWPGQWEATLLEEEEEQPWEDREGEESDEDPYNGYMEITCPRCGEMNRIFLQWIGPDSSGRQRYEDQEQISCSCGAQIHFYK